MKSVKTTFPKFQFFYPYTVALVGVRSGERVNFMSCAWHTALSFDPPLFGVLIAKKRLTHSLITAAGEFTVNFIGIEKIKLSAQMGRRSGHDGDKVTGSGVRLGQPKIIRSPVLEDAYVSFECRLLETRTYGDHDLFVGAVLAVHEEARAFTSEGILNPVRVHPLLYLGSDFYITVDPDTLKRVTLE